MYYTWKNIKKSFKRKIKISAPTWKENFDLPDGSCSILNISFKKHGKMKNDL